MYQHVDPEEEMPPFWASIAVGFFLFITAWAVCKACGVPF